MSTEAPGQQDDQHDLLAGKYRWSSQAGQGVQGLDSGEGTNFNRQGRHRPVCSGDAQSPVPVVGDGVAEPGGVDGLGVEEALEGYSA